MLLYREDYTFPKLTERQGGGKLAHAMLTSYKPDMQILMQFVPLSNVIEKVEELLQ